MPLTLSIPLVPAGATPLSEGKSPCRHLSITGTLPVRLSTSELYGFDLSGSGAMTMRFSHYTGERETLHYQWPVLTMEVVVHHQHSNYLKSKCFACHDN